MRRRIVSIRYCNAMCYMKSSIVGEALLSRASIAVFASGEPDNLGMLLEVSEYLFPERVRDLGVDAGVLDVLVAQVVGHGM